MIARTPTAIEGLDDLIGGGFPKNRTILLSGPCGAGKTIFSVQYLHNGITKYDENGVFITLGERKARMLEHMTSFGWGLRKLIAGGKLRIVDVTPMPKGPPQACKYMIADKPNQEFTMDSMAEVLKTNIEEVGAKRVAIDSLTALLLLPHKGFVQRHELLSLTRMLEDSGCTSILTTETPAGTTQETISGFEEFIVDGVIRLYYSLYRNEYKRTLTIRKMRATNHKNGVYSFGIEENAGIIVRTIAEWTV